MLNVELKVLSYNNINYDNYTFYNTFIVDVFLTNLKHIFALTQLNTHIFVTSHVFGNRKQHFLSAWGIKQNTGVWFIITEHEGCTMTRNSSVWIPRPAGKCCNQAELYSSATATVQQFWLWIAVNVTKTCTIIKPSDIHSRPVHHHLSHACWVLLCLELRH